MQRLGLHVYTLLASSIYCVSVMEIELVILVSTGMASFKLCGITLEYHLFTAPILCFEPRFSSRPFQTGFRRWCYFYIVFDIREEVHNDSKHYRHV